MKKISVIIFSWIFLALVAFPQHNRNAFRVSMEENWRDNQPNLESKGDVERLLFGDFNAPVEFFYFPAEEAVRIFPSGFRIARDSLDSSHILEVKYISNFAEAAEEASSRYPLIGVRFPSESTEEILQHNREAIAKQREMRLQLFEIETLQPIPVSQLFAEKLQEKMKALIGTFEEENPFPPNMVFIDEWNEWVEVVTEITGGYTVTFRTVVDDEVWTLWITVPRSRALVFSNLFKQMIADAKAGEFDEERYMGILSAM